MTSLVQINKSPVRIHSDFTDQFCCWCDYEYDKGGPDCINCGHCRGYHCKSSVSYVTLSCHECRKCIGYREK